MPSLHLRPWIRVLALLLLLFMVGFRTDAAPDAEVSLSTFLWHKEAELGQIDAPMTTGADWHASACGYVYSPMRTGAVTFEVQISTAGTYYLWARAMGLSWNENSFWVSIDGAEPSVLEIPQDDHARWAWVWQRVRSIATGDAVSLSTGAHRIQFRAREQNARLDTVLLTDQLAYLQPIIDPCTAITPTPSPTPSGSPTPTATPTAKPQNKNIALLGQVGGAQRALAEQGEQLYVLQGARVVVLDVSDRLCPQQIGQSEPLDALPQALAVSGSHLYVAAHDSGLQVIDVSSPAAPRLIANYPVPSATDIQVAGNTAYVMSLSGLYLFDISAQATPSLLGHFGMLSGPSTRGGRVFLSGHYALTYSSDGLVILDVSNPASPVLVGQTEAWMAEMALAGSYAYLLSEESLRVLDVSHLPSLSEVGYLSLPDFRGRAIGIWGDKAYIVGPFTEFVDVGYPLPIEYEELALVDIATPSQPALLDKLRLSAAGPGVDLWVAADVAYMAARGGRMGVFDLTDPLHPVEVANCPISAWSAGDVSGSATHAYVATGEGLGVVDASDPAHAAQVAAAVPYSGNTWAVDGDGPDIATSTNYVAESIYPTLLIPRSLNHVLSSIDVSDPSHPQVVGPGSHIPYRAAQSAGLAVSDGKAYGTVNAVGLGASLTSFVEALDLASGTSTGAWLLPGIIEPTRLQVAGNYAYVAAGNQGLLVVDLAAPDPNAPIVGELDVPAQNIALVGQYAYVVTGNSVSIADISMASSPTVQATFQPVGAVLDIYARDQHLYLLTASQLSMLDVSNPLSPVELGVFHSPADMSKVYAHGDRIYVAAGSSGLMILSSSLQPPASQWLYLPLMLR